MRRGKDGYSYADNTNHMFDANNISAYRKGEEINNKVSIKTQ